MIVDVGNLFKERNRGRGVTGFQGIPTAQQKRVTVARIQAKHTLQNLFSPAARTSAAQALGGCRINLPRFGFLSQPDVDLGQTNAHGDVFRVHLEDFLEDADGLLEFSGAQEFFGDLQILGAGVVEEALLRVQLRQFKNAFERGFELRDLLVHRDALDREALCGVRIANTLEAFGGLVGLADARVEVADRIQDSQVLGIGLQDLFVFGDRVLQLALLDILLRSAENLLFVESETERHKGADSKLSPRRSLTQFNLGSSGGAHKQPLPKVLPEEAQLDQHCHCKAGNPESYGYQGLPKGSVRPDYGRHLIREVLRKRRRRAFRIGRHPPKLQTDHADLLQEPIG